jgi:glucuronate isomerase
MDSDLLLRLVEQINSLPIYDIHTHIGAQKPFATSLADIIGYHYYTELANSAQYRPDFADESDPKEVVRQVVERLPLLANTVQFDWLAVIGQEFLGIERRWWQSRSWRELYDRAEEAIDAPGYRDEVLRRSNIRRIYMTNQCDEPLEGLDRTLLVPCLRTDSFVFEMDKPEERQRLERASGLSLQSLSDFGAALERVFRRFVDLGMAYAAISTWPGVQTRPVTEDEARPIWERMLAGETLDYGSRMVWAAYALNRIADNCRAVRKPFHLMVGVRRGAYPRGVTGGRDLLDSVNSLSGYDYLFNEYWDVRFPVSVLAETMGVELAASAWIRHNVFPSGHWWYLNNPVDIARELRRRLDVIPASKLIGYYSDAYCVEFILPKFRMYKYELARALAERVERSRTHPNMEPMTEEQALEMAQALLVDNPVNLFER